MIPPRELKIEGSQDKTNWVTVYDWYTTPEWERDWYYFAHTFDPMIFAFGMKIVMKGYRNSWYGNRHGIWSMNAFSQQQTVILQEKDIGDVPRCIARAEGLYETKNMPFILMNCYDAIL